MLALAAAAEVSSEHPLAAAVLAHAQAVLAPPTAESGASNANDISSLQRISQTSNVSSQASPHARDLHWVAPSSDLEILPGR